MEAKDLQGEGTLSSLTKKGYVSYLPEKDGGCWGERSLLFAASLAPENQGDSAQAQAGSHDNSQPRWSCTQEEGLWFLLQGARDACTRQENPAWPSVPNSQGLAGQGSLCSECGCGVLTSSPGVPLLPQTSSSS
jgi:hypothetical protein